MIKRIKSFLRRLWYRHIYLRSTHWRTFARGIRDANMHRCQHTEQYKLGTRTMHLKCNKPGTDVHHLTYKRIGKEQPEDVILLCRHHHADIHNRKVYKP